jgi:hypothetical protein
MRFDGRNCNRGTGPALEIHNDALLIERLQAFGLIESNGQGGWQMTECCQAGLAAFENDKQAAHQATPTVVRSWKPL